MFIVNVSFFVSADVQDRWLASMRSGFLPWVCGLGLADMVFSRVVGHSTEAAAEEGSVFSLMVRSPDRSALDAALDEITACYSCMIAPLFGNDTQWFTTLMEVVE